MARANHHKGDGTAKTESRLLLIKHVRRAPRNIFTFSGREGHCVALFRQKWPNVKVVSIDSDTNCVSVRAPILREPGIVMLRGDLINFTAGVKMARHCLTHYNSVRRQTKWKGVKTAKGPSPRNRGSETRIYCEMSNRWPTGIKPPPRRKFDLAFLDFTGLASTKNVDAAFDFIDKLTTSKATVALNFSEPQEEWQVGLSFADIVQIAQAAGCRKASYGVYADKTLMHFMILKMDRDFRGETETEMLGVITTKSSKN